MSAARFPPGPRRPWTISARVLRPNEEGTQPGYPVETAASSTAPERGKGRPWPARLEARAHLPRSHLSPGRHHQPVTLSAARKLCLRAFQGWGAAQTPKPRNAHVAQSTGSANRMGATVPAARRRGTAVSSEKTPFNLRNLRAAVVEVGMRHLSRVDVSLRSEPGGACVSITP